MISRRSNGTTKPMPDVVDVVAADDRARAALEDAEDAPFGAVVADPLDARDDAVAVHRLIEVAAGDVDVAGRPLPAAGRARRSRSPAGGS